MTFKARAAVGPPREMPRPSYNGTSRTAKAKHRTRKRIVWVSDSVMLARQPGPRCRATHSCAPSATSQSGGCDG